MNPIIANVMRGDRVESVHRGLYAVCDPGGHLVLSAGDIDAPIFPRSAMKLIQALPLVESGAAYALGLTDRSLAIACASHSSAPDQTEEVRFALGRAGVSEDALACGAHWPLYRTQDVVDMSARGDKPSRIHNNCSGKHAGFLCTCAHAGMPLEGYVDHSHELQTEIRGTLESVCGTPIVDDGHGIDGCSAPTYALSLKGLAKGFAKLASGQGIEQQRAAAAQRLMSACMNNPYLVAGEARMCTDIMTMGRGRLFAKFGAEGVYVAAIPELGLGIAMKCDDGSARAVEVLLGALFKKLLPADDVLQEALVEFDRQKILSFAGQLAGEVRAVVN